MELTVLIDPTTELCECQPLSTTNRGQKEYAGEDYQPMTPATPELGAYLREELARYFPRSSPISVLLLHITQLEQVHLSPKSAMLHRRHRLHAPASFLEQVLANVHRTIRSSDPVVVHGGAGAAIIFPDVDQEGAFSIVERAFHGINLLQPETVIPPLARETDIFLGMGSYPKPASSLEELFYHISCVAHRLTLRPAVSAQIQSLIPTGHEAAMLEPLSTPLSSYGFAIRQKTRSLAGRKESLHKTGQDDEMSEPGEIEETNPAVERSDAHIHPDGSTTGPFPSAGNNGIPFMQLPAKLPARLKHLIPYYLARELRCAPVGRDHNRLTVAMAHPTDTHSLDVLKTTTCMIIYPVACELDALNTLLANEW